MKRHKGEVNRVWDISSIGGIEFGILMYCENNQEIPAVHHRYHSAHTELRTRDWSYTNALLSRNIMYELLVRLWSL